MLTQSLFFSFFFFNDTATTEIYTLPYTTLFRSDRALGLKLGIVGEMLELTAAAMIADVVRAWWRDSPRAGFDDFADVRAGEVAMALQRPFPQSDPIAGRGPRHEHDSTIAQPTHD